MITAAGEALIDIVIGDAGTVNALPGGAPFNVARLVARLGGEAQFLGMLSEDPLGGRLRMALAQAGVRIAIAHPTSAPTTLATAVLDEAGAAEYRFYLEGTSAAALSAAELAPDVLDGSSAVALGGLGLALEPTASSLIGLLGRRPPSATVLLDPNCRPAAVTDLARYRRTVDEVLAQVDVVKASVEDLAVLRPVAEPAAAARELLALGPRAVIVTDGAAPVALHTSAGQRLVPVQRVTAVDTIGAGDAFVAGLLTWWTARSLAPDDIADAATLTAAARAAVEVATASCAVRGADLPEGFAWSAAADAPGAR